MGAVVRAHSVGLHVLLHLCVRVPSLVAANVVETVFISQFPYQFGSSQAVCMWVDTLSLACECEPERLGPVPASEELTSWSLK